MADNTLFLKYLDNSKELTERRLKLICNANKLSLIVQFR